VVASEIQIEVACSSLVILILNSIETAVKAQYLCFFISALVTKKSGKLLSARIATNLLNVQCSGTNTVCI
jgi:hypothetical protein